MKKRIYLTGIILAVAGFVWMTQSPKLFANESADTGSENATIKAFLKEYQDSPESNVEAFFASTSSDDDKVIVAPEGGYFFQRADVENDDIIPAAIDDDGREVAGTALDLNGKDATTVGQLRQALAAAKAQ